MQALTLSTADSFDTIMDQLNRLMKAKIAAEFTKVNASKLGLDSRAGIIYISDDSIVVNIDNSGLLEYFGGFEYVDRSCIMNIGDWKIYSIEDERVREAIDYYHINTED